MPRLAQERMSESVKMPLEGGVAMMMEGCGMAMMVMMWAAGLLGLGLLASLVVLVWVLIGRLRRSP
jgi:hypothetical protein